MIPLFCWCQHLKNQIRKNSTQENSEIKQLTTSKRSTHDPVSPIPTSIPIPKNSLSSSTSLSFHENGSTYSAREVRLHSLLSDPRVSLILMGFMPNMWEASESSVLSLFYYMIIADYYIIIVDYYTIIADYYVIIVSLLCIIISLLCIIMSLLYIILSLLCIIMSLLCIIMSLLYQFRRLSYHYCVLLCHYCILFCHYCVLLYRYC